MAHQASSFEKRLRSAALPFGHRWHLEVSPHTHLLLERRDSRTKDKVGSTQHNGFPEARGSQLEIDFLNFESGWDMGFVLEFVDAGNLLRALESRAPVRTPNWAAEPGWITLYDQPVMCQFELTSLVRSALILRLQTVLKSHVAANEGRKHR